MFDKHEFYQKETESIHYYYIIDGKGIASIDGMIYELEQGDFVEIPIGIEFTFKGKLKMIEVMYPSYNPETHINTRENNL